MRFSAWFRDTSIPNKFIFIAFLSILAAMVFSIFLSSLLQWFTMREDLVKNISAHASVIASISTEELLSHNRDAAEKTVRSLANIDSIEFAGILDSRGNDFALYVRPGINMSSHHHHPGNSKYHIHTWKYIEIMIPVLFKQERIGTIHVRSSMAPMYEQLKWTILITSVSAVGAFLIALGMLLFLMPTIITPLNDLVALMKRVTYNNDFSLRTKLSGSDEIGALSTGFNAMLEQIQSRDEKLAQYRVHLEQEVAQRTARLTEAQRIAHLGDWEWDIVNDTLYWSDEIYRIFGLTPQQFRATYDAFISTVHPEDRKLLDTHVREALMDGKPYSIDHRILLPDGSLRYVHEQAEVLQGEDGKAVKMQGTVQDITNRKRDEDKLRKQQKLTKQIIETIPMRVFWKDHDLRYLGCNTLFAKDAGLMRPEQLIGKDDFDMTWRDQAELYRADDRHVMDSNAPKLSYDEPQTTPEGKNIWLRTSKVPLHNDANETVGMLGVYEDITPYKEAEEKLRESEARYRAIFEHADDIIYLLSSEGIFNSLSPSFEIITGWKPKELVGKSFANIVHPNDLPRANDVFQNVLSGRSTPIFELRIAKKTGGYFHSELSLVPVNPGGEIAAIGIARDVTERKNSEQILEESERKFRTILDVAVDGVLLVDVKSQKFISGNHAICDMLGYRLQELYELGVQDIHPEDMLPEVFRQFERQMSGEIRVAQNLPVKRKDGSIFLADVSSAPMVLGGRTIMVGFFHDVTERKRIEEEIKLLATTDTLTGTANRREFNTQLEKEIERAERYGTPLSLVMYDIDHFKQVNDTFGHDAGDSVLQTLTAVVKSNVRAVDTVARWGGEEFMILMPQSDETAASGAAEKLRQEISQHPFDQIGTLTVSFGVTEFAPDDDSNAFLKRVDDALYKAKENGRNRVEIL